MKSNSQIPEDPAARRDRARRRAERAETECAMVNGRADLLLRAARDRLTAGDAGLARAQVEALLTRAADDPDFAPAWLVRQVNDLLVLIDRHDDGEPPCLHHDQP